MKKEDNSPTVADMEQLLQRIRSTHRLTDEQIAKAAWIAIRPNDLSAIFL